MRVPISADDKHKGEGELIVQRRVDAITDDAEDQLRRWALLLQVMMEAGGMWAAVDIGIDE